MARPPAVVHWLRGNETERSPHRLFVFDTETQPIDAAHPDEQRLRLWSGSIIRRHDIEPRRERTERVHGHTAAELAVAIDAATKSDYSTWVVAHNLGFDLAVTALPVELVELGWRLTDGALTSDSPWCRMARGGRHLTMADSWSWLPTSVELLGPLVGVAKLPLPEWGDSDAAWWLRADADVDITSAAVVQLMDWWDRASLGSWSLTGPACGWSTYRHRQPKPRVLIDPDPLDRAFEARAVVGGRRDVRRVGELPAGLYVDLDLTTAHLAVMATQPLPVKRAQHFDGLALSHGWLRGRPYDVIAECELDVRTARYPWDSGRGILHPVGRFRTVLAGPSIREAMQRGELVSIGRGIAYLMDAHMMSWAKWVDGILSSDDPDVPPVAKLTAKGWSRTTAGKWSARTSEVTDRIPDPRPGWSVIHGRDGRTMAPLDLFRMGGELLTIRRDLWADDAFPAILAFVQDHVRVALGRLLDASGSAWLTCNTDGALIDAIAWALDHPELVPPGRLYDRHILPALAGWLESMAGELAPFLVRVKGVYRRATVFGSQHLILDDERRLSGIPRRAVLGEDDRWHFTAWPSLRVQLTADGPPRYRIDQRSVKLADIPPPGWLHENGHVTPAELWQPGAGPEPLWPLRPEDDPYGPLAAPERQHAALLAMLRAGAYRA